MDTLHTANNVVLLDNTRKIEKLIHNNDTGKVVFNDICRVMSDILQAHIFVISKKGKVLGVGECAGIPVAHGLIADELGTFVDRELNTRLLDILSTHENVALQTLGFLSVDDRDLMGIVLPIEVAASAWELSSSIRLVSISISTISFSPNMAQRSSDWRCCALYLRRPRRKTARSRSSNPPSAHSVIQRCTPSSISLRSWTV